MKIHCIKHVPEEGPESIASWAQRKGHSMSYSLLYEFTAFPKVHEFDLLVVMGGPMSYDDDEIYPWLRIEKHFIKECVAAQKCVLGICLGAQLIAESIDGAGCHSSSKEIGWFPLSFNNEALRQIGLVDFPESIDVFHWHGDTFNIPKGARRIASTPEFPNQGFVFNERVIGLQFHLEATEESVRNMVNTFSSDLVPAIKVQAANEILNNTDLCLSANQYMDKFLNYLESKYQ